MMMIPIYEITVKTTRSVDPLKHKIMLKEKKKWYAPKMSKVLLMTNHEFQIRASHKWICKNKQCLKDPMGRKSHNHVLVADQ